MQITKYFSNNHYYNYYPCTINPSLSESGWPGFEDEQDEGQCHPERSEGSIFKMGIGFRVLGVCVLSQKFAIKFIVLQINKL